jgi:hypothetical protein
VSPDLSPVIEIFFDAMELDDKTTSLIISMNLCIIKNVVQLSKLDFHDVNNMFSQKTP